MQSATGFSEWDDALHTSVVSVRVPLQFFFICFHCGIYFHNFYFFKYIYLDSILNILFKFCHISGHIF